MKRCAKRIKRQLRAQAVASDFATPTTQENADQAESSSPIDTQANDRTLTMERYRAYTAVIDHAVDEANR